MALIQCNGGMPEVWEELVINHNLRIPDHKPPMEKLLGYKIEFEITKAQVIATPLQTDDDPPRPIRKIIIDGLVKIVVKYVADVPDQQVHGAHFEENFSTLIEWPDGPPPGTPICVEIVKEHIQIHQLNDRDISKTIVIQINVTQDEECGCSCQGGDDQ